MSSKPDGQLQLGFNCVFNETPASVAIAAGVIYVTPMSYEPHNYMVAPAKDYPQTWRLVLGCLAAFVLYFALSFLMFGGAGWMLGDAWVRPFIVPGTPMSPAQTLFILASFIAMVAAICLVTILFHHRNPATLLGGIAPAIADFKKTLVILSPLIFVFVVIAWLSEDLQSNISIGLWTVLLPLSLGFLLIQVSAEEMVFRGYLQSQIAATGAPTFLWIAIPSILFGLGHYQAELFGDLAPYFVIWAIVFGLLAADLTARTGNLGAAIAFHFANNAVAILLVGLKDQLGGLALFVYPFSVSETAELAARLPADAVAIFVLYIGARLAIRA